MEITNHRLNPRETAFFVIDVQRQFCTPTNWGANLQDRISRYVESIAGKGLLFVYTKSVGNNVPENVRRFRNIRGLANDVMSDAAGARLCPMYIPLG